MKFAWNKFEQRLALLFAALSLASVAYTFSRPPQLHLTLEMAASAPSAAQLFYDIGNGFNQTDSDTVPISTGSLSSFQTLSFPLPEKTLLRLRFDPLTTAGSIVIRNIAIRNRNAIVTAFAPSQVTAFNQIANRIERQSEVEFATLPGANDPGLTLSFPKPIDLHAVAAGQNLRQLALINLAFLCIFCALLAAKRKILALAGKSLNVINRLNARLNQLAETFPRDSFLKIDAPALGIYFGLAVLFLAACLLDLNGSSAGMYRVYGNGPNAKILIGSPKPTRVDEWAYSTPDVFNQYFRADRFAFQDSVLGSHNIALAGNVPVKHISALFRPQLWSFFVLPVSYAFSVYWQAKSLLLVAGVFTLLLLVTRSSPWALVGALWYFFSPFMQWSFSWPTGLPEMVGSLCIGLVCFCYLTVGQSRKWLALSAGGLACSGINFAMCAYPPHLIPLAWAGLLLAGAWCLSNRDSILTANQLTPRVAALLLSFTVILAVGFIVFRDLKPAINAVAETLYPGRRVLAGGNLPIWGLVSHFLPWTETENHFPAALRNICEGSGFLWLAPLTLFCLPSLQLSSFQKAALISLWICFLMLFCWCAFPMPAIFGSLTGLDRCAGSRTLPALGLANVAIVALTMACLKRGVTWVGWQWAILTAAFVFFLAAFWATNDQLNKFFSPPVLAADALFAAFLGMLLITGKSRQLALSLLIPQALAFGFINPVEIGMREFTRSNFNRFVQSHREMLQGKWLVYSDTPVRSGFVAEAGCEVYTGTRYIPDIDHFALFAARGLDLNTFNRLGYLDAHPIAPGEPTRFIQVNPIIVKWEIAPTDPLLTQIGIRFVTFDSQPQPNWTKGLTPVNSAPIDGLWIYQLNASPR